MKFSEIVIGGNLHREKETGTLIDLYGYSSSMVWGRTFEGDSKSYNKKELKNLEISEFSDWPKLATTNPLLPYAFDLNYDIKRPAHIFRPSTKKEDKKGAILIACDMYKNNEEFKTMLNKATGGPLMQLLKEVKKLEQKQKKEPRNQTKKSKVKTEPQEVKVISTPISASTLLFAESSRLDVLKHTMPEKAQNFIESQVWAYKLAATFLESLGAPERIKKYRPVE